MTAAGLMKILNAPCKGPIVDPYDLSRDFFELSPVGVIEGYTILPNGNLERAVKEDIYLIPAYFASLWLEQSNSDDIRGRSFYDCKTLKLFKWTSNKNNNNYIYIAKKGVLENTEFSLNFLKGYDGLISEMQNKAVLPRELFTNINSFVYLLISATKECVLKLRI